MITNVALGEALIQEQIVDLPSDWVLMNSYAYDAKLYVLASRDNAGWENLLGNMTANNSTIILNITYLSNT